MTKKHTIVINAISATQGGGQVYISKLLQHAEAFPEFKIYVFTTNEFVDLYTFPGIG